MAGELITADGQLEYNGYLLGDNNITFLDAINGWDDLPPIDSGNVIKPNSHGAWSGRKLANQRIITWEGRFAANENDWVAELVRLRNAFSVPSGTEEYPITVRLHDETLTAFGALVARAIPGDRTYGYYGAKLTLQFECSDPRRYSVGENVWSLSLPTPVLSGLEYPLEYPLDYGIEVTSNTGTLYNYGNIVTPVIFTFTGPMTNPSLINSTAGMKLAFNINLSETDQLTVNTKNGTVLLNGSADRLYTRTTDSVPISMFGLIPGANSMLLSAATWQLPAGVTISWRNATL